SIFMTLFRLFEQIAVFQRFALFPASIEVAEIDALAERRMAGLPYFDQSIRAAAAQIFLVQADERCSGRVVVARGLETEPVGVVFVVTGVGQGDGADDQEISAEE